MRITLSVVGLCFLLMIFVGCETVKGLGKDIENTGRNIQKLMTRDTKSS